MFRLTKSIPLSPKDREGKGKCSVVEVKTNGASHLTILTWALVITLASLVMPFTVTGQVLYGSITGTVTDQAGAAIVGAKVQSLNTGTGATKDATTDEKGSYQFTDLQPGVYKVTIVAASFKTVVQESINVEANTLRRIDAHLDVASVVNETVTVSATTVPLQSDRADLNTVQTTRQVNDLPLTGSVGRNYQSLMALVPGAVMQGEQNSAAGSPQRSISFNVNGVSRLQNNTRIDGAGVTYPWLPTNTAYVPTAESIQEVSIVTNSFNAEQGLAGGAAVNVITKSGTNAFHGAGWDYLTNSATQARNFFQTTPTVPKSILNQIGYTVSGPILKNKLFFFTDLESTTQRNTSRLNLLTIAPSVLRPTPQGVDFSSTGVTIYDPASNPDPRLRTPFPNNVIPFNRIDPGSIALISLLPQTTFSGFNNNYLATGSAQFNRKNIDSKVSYNANSKFTMFGRYSISPTLIVEPPVLGAAGGDALNGGQLGEAPGRVQVFAIGGTYVFGSTLVLDATIGYTRQRLGAEAPDINSNFGLDVMKIPGTNGPDRLQGGIPFFNVNGWANMGNSNTGNPFLFRDNQYVTTWNLSWQKQAHQLRFGLDGQDQQLNHFQPQGGTFQTVRGTFQFNGNATKLQNDPNAPTNVQFNSWADFLLGLPSGAGKVDQLRNPNSLRLVSYALYARDQWQASPNLTITYGLRWERYPFPTKDNTGINRFDPATGNVLTGCLSGVPCDTGASSGPGQFLPRIGFAYRFKGKEDSRGMVIRGGYGQSADPRPFIDFRNAYPVVNAWAMPGIQFNNATNPFIPVTTLRQGLINTGGTPDLTQGILKLPANSGTTTYPDHQVRKYIQSWNLTVERELPWKMVGQVGYAGTRAVGQMGFININASAPGTGTAGRPLFATFGLTQDINEILPYKTTTYDSLQATLRRRWAGSTFGITYTFSKAINYADNDANPRIQYFPDAQQNRGLASYDRTHNFQMYGVIDLPFGKGQRWANERVLNWVAGGWQVNAIMQVQSGTPFSIIQGSGGNLNALGSAQVPDQINPVVAYTGSGIGTGNFYFDKSAFAPVAICVGKDANGNPCPAQRFGNVGRNTLRGPGFFNVDMGLFRSFTVTERLKVQFRAEGLNVLNHPNFANPTGDISNGNFGLIFSTVGQGSRLWRFALRLSF